MKSTYLLIVFLTIFISSCSTKSLNLKNGSIPECNKVLLGKWQSDREKTLDWIKNNRKLSEEKINKLDKAVKFGTMVVEISEDYTSYTYGGETTVENNNIIGSTCNTVAFLESNPLTKEEEIRLVRIEGENSYSIYVDWTDIREFFKKIK